MGKLLLALSSLVVLLDALSVVRLHSLPWDVPIVEIEARVREECASHGWVLTECVVRAASVRARDADKLHSGSAWLKFDSSTEAAAAVEVWSSTALSFGDRASRCKLGRESDEEEEAEPPKELTKRQINREQRARRGHHRRNRAVRRLERTLSVLGSVEAVTVDTLLAPPLEWAECPSEIDPARGGRLPEERASRKRAQIESMAFVAKTLAAKSIVDVGAGTGNLALPLAWATGAHVVAVDLDEVALAMLASRVEGGLSVATVVADAAELGDDVFSGGENEILVSLHACGAASDLAIEAAVRRRLAFAVSPCCLGKALRRRDPTKAGMPPVSSPQRAAAPESITYPRSQWLANALVGSEDEDEDDDAYSLLAAAADYGNAPDAESEEELARARLQRNCKRIVETDRLMAAQERGYYTRLVEIPSMGPTYPKRELLLGSPLGSEAAAKLKSLPVGPTPIIEDFNSFV